MLVNLRILTAFLSASALFAADADRDVALWALRMGGYVVLEGSPQRIREIPQLPDRDYRIEVLNLIGTNMHPPHMEAFAKLTALRELHLPGPMWNPRAESKTEYGEEIGHLAGLATLKKLTFSYTFLETIKFRDNGVAKMKPLGPTLEELVLRRARVTGPGLENFTNLRSLDITWTQIEDGGMKHLASLTKLKKLWANEIRITDEGLKPLKDLKELEELHVRGTPITDTGLSYLAGLTNLKKLDILSSDVTDAGLDSLAGMKDLEYLNLYRTKVSNAGLEKLKRFTNLRQVDLRYTRATQAGVQSLRAALPRTEFIFLDSGSKPAGGKPQQILAGKGDPAIADWVQTIGGKAVMKDGALIEVSLRGTAVSDEQLRSFEGLSKLRSLNLDGAEIGDLGVQALSALPLMELSLNNTGVSDAGLEYIAKIGTLEKLRLDNTLIEGPGLSQLKSLGKLRELSLLGCPVKNDGVAVLEHLKELRRLSVASTDIKDDGMKFIGALSNLEYLDLTSTDITDKGLAYLTGLTNLRDLVLDYSFRFSDAGMKHLSGLTNLRNLSLLRTPLTDKAMPALAGLTSLETLNLDYTNIGDTGLAEIAGLKNLRSLGVDSTFVSDKSRELLSGLKKLESLNLYHTTITAPVHRELKTALPGCKIIWDEASANPNRRRS